MWGSTDQDQEQYKNITVWNTAKHCHHRILQEHVRISVSQDSNNLPKEPNNRDSQEAGVIDEKVRISIFDCQFNSAKFLLVGDLLLLLDGISRRFVKEVDNQVFKVCYEFIQELFLEGFTQLIGVFKMKRNKKNIQDRLINFYFLNYIWPLYMC